MRAGTASAISMGLTVQMNNKRIRNLAAPSATKDAATKAYVDGKHVAVYNVSLAWTDGIATYENSAIFAVNMHDTDLDGSALRCVPLDTKPVIHRL